MIIMNFLVGLLIFVVPFSVMYGLGLWVLKRSGDYDADTDFVEIMFNGLLVLMLMVACVILLIVIYKVGGLVINNLI